MGINQSATNIAEKATVIETQAVERTKAEQKKKQRQVQDAFIRHVHQQTQANQMRLFAHQPKQQKAHAKQAKQIHQPVARAYR